MDATIYFIDKNKLNESIELLIPSSKSHTIRALLFAAMADGESVLINPLDSADARSCIDACKVLGAEIIRKEDKWIVKGTGGNFPSKIKNIDVGNSGTTLYLAAGIASLSSEEIFFTGDEQIQKRPVKPLLDSLSDLGAQIKGSDNGCAPFNIKGPITGGKTSIECPTSQYLSSLLITAPLAKEETIIEVPLLMEQPYVEMTLKWLDEQDIKYKNDNFKKFIIPGNQKYTPFKKAIPGDFSSAAFPLCAAAITGSKLTLKGLDVTDSQGDKAVIDYLKMMNCVITSTTDTVSITGPGHSSCPEKKLIANNFDLNKTPDALPIMAVTACFAEGTTKLYNVPQARLKETDRIAVMHEELTKLGAEIEELDDGLIIHGGKQLKGCKVEGHGDHRVVMALAVAALKAEGKTIITDSEAVDITYPGFFEMLDSLCN
ncbi:MAG: 3-phosphoshikimate 1-carboxyvinyltransferase [Spirochaetales bacterium]|nr:3-phosphoshikimate 1-carboxyvinyltransferase [Spirochaetales bacterium]